MSIFARVFVRVLCVYWLCVCVFVCLCVCVFVCLHVVYVRVHMCVLCFYMCMCVCVCVCVCVYCKCVCVCIVSVCVVCMCFLPYPTPIGATLLDSHPLVNPTGTSGSRVRACVRVSGLCCYYYGTSVRCGVTCATHACVVVHARARVYAHVKPLRMSHARAKGFAPASSSIQHL